jgi:predicted lipid-binding transport protein (Tim44 family)
MDLLIFAIIAFYFIYKLNIVLGNKDYNYEHHHERMSSFTDEASTTNSSEEKTIHAKVELTDEEAIINKNPQIIEILKQVRKFDPNFREDIFIKNASSAFEMILSAFTQHDQNILKMLVSKKIYEEFLKHIENNQKKQVTIEQSLVSLQNVELLKGRIDNNRAYLTIQYLSDQIYVMRDKDQNILEGHPSKIMHKVDLWTFSKDLTKAEPIWELMIIE